MLPLSALLAVARKLPASTCSEDPVSRARDQACVVINALSIISPVCSVISAACSNVHELPSGHTAPAGCCDQPCWQGAGHKRRAGLRAAWRGLKDHLQERLYDRRAQRLGSAGVHVLSGCQKAVRPATQRALCWPTRERGDQRNRMLRAHEQPCATTAACCRATGARPCHPPWAQAEYLRQLNASGHPEAVVQAFEGGRVAATEEAMGEYVKALVRLDRCGTVTAPPAGLPHG